MDPQISNKIQKLSVSLKLGNNKVKKNLQLQLKLHLTAPSGNQTRITIITNGTEAQYISSVF